MAAYHKKVNGGKVWWVRVNHKGLNASRVCRAKEGAKLAESELLQNLKRRACEAEQDRQMPATVKALFDSYVADLEARGKESDTIGRAAQTALAVERAERELLVKAVGKVTRADLFAFRSARQREGARASTINRDLRTIRAMFKKARPKFHVTAGVFFPEDERRVRWLRAEEEILVLDTMSSPFM